MKNTAPILLPVLAILALAACAQAPWTLPPGEYSKTESSTDANGTEHKNSTDTTVYYDENGHKRAVQEDETTTDPKGFLNKSTKKTTKTY